MQLLIFAMQHSQWSEQRKIECSLEECISTAQRRVKSGYSVIQTLKQNQANKFQKFGDSVL